MTNTEEQPFSIRLGHLPPATEPPIIVRDDAPSAFRQTVADIGIECLDITSVYEVIRETLGLQKDRRFKGRRTIEEVDELLALCHWARVYDVAEALFSEINARYGILDSHRKYEADVNEYCVVSGIGWRMVDGRFQVRTSSSEDVIVRSSIERLAESGKQTAAGELREAMRDLSRRPDPDLTGATQHTGAALECLARDLCGDPKLTLGDIIKFHPRLFPGGYRKLAEGVWGIVSNKGRHLAEGGEPTFNETALLVGTVAALCTYLISEHSSRGE